MFTLFLMGLKLVSLFFCEKEFLSKRNFSRISVIRVTKVFFHLRTKILQNNIRNATNLSSTRFIFISCHQQHKITNKPSKNQWKIVISFQFMYNSSFSDLYFLSKTDKCGQGHTKQALLNKIAQVCYESSKVCRPAYKFMIMCIIIQKKVAFFLFREAFIC